MKLAVLLIALALVAGVQGAAKKKQKKNAEGEYYFEWEYYKAEAVKQVKPKTGFEVTIREQVTTVKNVPYQEKYKKKITEFEYVGNLISDGFTKIKPLKDINAPCANHFVRDCGIYTKKGQQVRRPKCAPAYWIANGICDDGRASKAPWLAKNEQGAGGSYNFNCPAFWMDGGDCASKTPPPAKMILNAQMLQNPRVGVPALAVGVLIVVAVVGLVQRR
jgi:hypothetical protein